jgi:hypothetical protein
MLDALLHAEGESAVALRTGILYRGPAEPELKDERSEKERQQAREWLGLEEGSLEIIDEPDAYREAVADLVTAPDSTARRVALAPFDTVPFHLSGRCDGCLYSEFCLAWSAQRDDLSLLPHLTPGDKRALERAEIRSTADLAGLKEPGAEGPLVAASGREDTVRRLGATWPIGPRLDELVHRARAFRRWKGDAIAAPRELPNKGHTSLPFCGPNHNPNLVRVYLDAQHDYLEDRVYLLGALVVGCEDGIEAPHRRRSVLRMAEGPPRKVEDEADLLRSWIDGTLRAVAAVAAPDETGATRAPLHLIFFSQQEQQALLDALARHFRTLAASTPLYDFLTQLAAFDSPVATFLDQEMRERKNYPLLCQSLPAVAAFLGFDWDRDAPFRQIFRTRHFDYAAADDEGGSWHFRRARFGSQIPLEYAYQAWGDLPADTLPANSAPITPDLLVAFQARRLEAIEWIARDFPGNDRTLKRSFDLPRLEEFVEKAPTPAHALDEFVTIERHVELGAWKAARLIPPERRVLMGETLLGRYWGADQTPEVAEANREHLRREALREEFAAARRAEALPDEPIRLSKEERAASDWSPEGLSVCLRLEGNGVDADLDEILTLTSLREGERIVVYRRWTEDERVPAGERVPFTPTPKQMLYGSRATLSRIEIERDAAGRAIAARVLLAMTVSHAGAWARGFVFGSMDRPFREGELYTLDPDPNDWYGYWCAKVTEALVGEATEGSGAHTLYSRLVAPEAAAAAWPPEAAAAQERFLAGLEALHAAGALHAFEASKREYIGRHGGDAVLLVQGPPGTGKSYATAFALFARVQGAMAAGRPFRAFLSCKTHAATDVLLQNVTAVRARLGELREVCPEIWDAHFDPRLLEVPLYRIAPRGTAPAGVCSLAKDGDKGKGEPRNADVVTSAPWCVVAATPGGVYGMITKKWTGKSSLFGHHFCDLLILDEASQMNLPEAMMAALPLRPDSPLIVVGDHRQMPPIVKHEWEAEPRRTFREFAAYESLFVALRPLADGLIQFEESFRLHRAMAEFLRQEIYRHDGIHYHSRRRDLLPTVAAEDPFVRAALAPEHPLVVVVHDEAASQTRNPFEQALIDPILRALAGRRTPAPTALPAGEGALAASELGVVVPHRAQRAALQRAFPFLAVIDPETEATAGWAIDTVERFQGGERDTILACATESDREYLLAASEFLLDPRRLTVAVSRARRKMILVASRTVFSLFSPSEEVFHRALLWKNLLRRTCTDLLWEGERDGHRVQVWGAPAG